MGFESGLVIGGVNVLGIVGLIVADLGCSAGAVGPALEVLRTPS